MSARKLGRLAGLVFVFAVVFGGAGAAWSAERESGIPGHSTVIEDRGSVGKDNAGFKQEDGFSTFDVDWT